MEKPWICQISEKSVVLPVALAVVVSGGREYSGGGGNKPLAKETGAGLNWDDGPSAI